MTTTSSVSIQFLLQKQHGGGEWSDDATSTESDSDSESEDFSFATWETETGREPLIGRFSVRKAEKTSRKARFALGCGFIMVACLLGTVAGVFVGAEIERKIFDRAPPTTSLYQTQEVCALDKISGFSTFESLQSARTEGRGVAHCGECGQCSTVKDMTIMAGTKDTLTKATTKCGVKLFLGGREAVASCMDKTVGFTAPCSDCWLDNISCTMRKCSFTCIKSIYFLGEGNNESNGRLNSCLECDEKLCGPEFLKCSGANRRQMGIVSDIGRSEMEQCSVVDMGWGNEARVP